VPDDPETHQDLAGERFLTLDDVARVLSTSRAQIYALVRRRDLEALKLGGRGQWRVERDRLEAFIARTYTETDEWIREHPWSGDEALNDEADP